MLLLSPSKMEPMRGFLNGDFLATAFTGVVEPELPTLLRSRIMSSSRRPTVSPSVTYVVSGKEGGMDSLLGDVILALDHLSWHALKTKMPT